MSNKIIPATVILVLASSVHAAEIPDANDSSKYLNVVREFANNVLKYGRDTYGPKHTPLFVDGLNIHTHEPVKWISPVGDVLTATETEEWILSDFASQQTLLRTLDGLSTITGDPKYRDAAKHAIKYSFEHLRAPNGLFYWGNMVAYDALTETVRGKITHHTIKLHYPYYELMWAVDPGATRKFIEAFWVAHIKDWSNLDMNRIGKLDMADFSANPWVHSYDGNGPVFYRSASGSIGFLTTGSSLIHAGATLYNLSRQEEPLIWSTRLAKRYVATRNPNTGISYEAYNTRWSELGDDLEGNFNDERTTFFPFRCFNPNPLGGPLHDYNSQPWPWLSFFLVGQMLGNKGDEFTQWALQEFTAWGKSSYRSRDNVFVPILTNGVNLEGYVLKNVITRSGRADFVVEPLFAGPSRLWSYAAAYAATSDSFMWQMTRNIAAGNNYGDIGESLGKRPKLNTDTECSDVYSLLGFLELYNKTNKPEFLSICRRIADNILENKFHEGFFVLSKRHIYSRFDCCEALALLHLIAAIEHTSFSVPDVWPSLPMFRPEYRYKDELIDRIGIYDLTNSTEVPISLQEAVAIGDIGLLTRLIDDGIQLNGTEDGTRHTAIHRAAIRGNRDVAKLLIVRGAEIDTKDSSGSTPLHYALQEGHKDLVELLIEKGADITVKNQQGRTPLHMAALQGNREIVEALVTHGADVNVKDNRGITPLILAQRRRRIEIVQILTKAAQEQTTVEKKASSPQGPVKDLPKGKLSTEERNKLISELFKAIESNKPEKAKEIIAQGPEILLLNVRTNSGDTLLIHAIKTGSLPLVETLISGGAGVSVRNRTGETPLHSAVFGGYKDVVELLIANGANINAQDRRGNTPLNLAKQRGHTEIIDILTKAAEEQATSEK